MKLKQKAIGHGLKTGMRHSYNNISEEKLAKMMEVTYQDRIEAKMRWAVKLYKDWHQMRLDRVDYEDEIYEADIENIANVTKEKFKFALCRFICEVKKSKDQGDFPGHTLYQILCSIQNYLRKKEINWKLVHGTEFCQLE